MDAITRNYIVGIEVTSETLTCDAISTALGIARTAGANRGEPRRGGGIAAQTCWRFDPVAPDDTALSGLLRAVFARCPATSVTHLRALDPAATVTLRIAVVDSAYTCTVEVAPEFVRAASERGLAIEFSSYPGDGS